MTRQQLINRLAAQKPQANENRGHCRILDLSTYGAGLRVSKQFKVGATITLALKNSTGVFQCERVARVTHARRDGDSWIVGCQFTAPLTDSEARWFKM